MIMKFALQHVYILTKEKNTVTILNLENVKKVYKTKSVITEALTEINFSASEGEFISIMGESGSGKTTLLNIIATLDKATSGNVFIKDKNIGLLKDSEIASFRRNELGFVFQDFNLLDQFSNKDNIFLPLVLSGVSPSEMEAKLDKIKDILGIAAILDKFPYEISGGQKQRIAIARAVIVNPSILLADEPTGALDSASTEMILNLFRKINETGQTILMVTHSLRAAAFAKRVIFIKDGVVYHELYRGDKESLEEFMERINNSQKQLFTSNYSRDIK